MKIIKTTLQEFYANSPNVLWTSQQDLEICTSNLFNARELFRDARLTFDLAHSDKCNELVNDGKTITTAKEIAKGLLKDEYTKVSITREAKRKLTITYETIKERINTIKKLMSDVGGQIK